MYVKSKSIPWVLSAILSFCAMLFWIIGFFGGFAQFKRPERYDTPKPLNGIGQIAVDSSGNIYYGSKELGTIQVYDNTGGFLYGFSFIKGTNPYFAFYIDDTDKLYLISQGGHGVYTFQNGNLIALQEFANREERVAAMEKFERKQPQKLSDSAGNSYQLMFFNKVDMYNSAGQYIRTIKPKSPIWPFPIFVNWVLSATSFSFAWFSIYQCIKLTRLRDHEKP